MKVERRGGVMRPHGCQVKSREEFEALELGCAGSEHFVFGAPFALEMPQYPTDCFRFLVEHIHFLSSQHLPPFAAGYLVLRATHPQMGEWTNDPNMKKKEGRWHRVMLESDTPDCPPPFHLVSQCLWTRFFLSLSFLVHKI